MIEGLYLITDADPDDQFFERVRAALRGGVRILQYRDKTDRSDAEKVEIAKDLLAVCRQHDATFIVNDLPELALASDADGVHLGQGDGSVAEARRILGPHRIIGLSTRTVEQALKAEMQGADYIGVGSMFATASKHDAEVVGIDTLKKVRRAVNIPIVAIGGIDRDGAEQALEAGADAVAVISAVMQDPDPAIAAGEIALLFNRKTPLPRGQVLSIAGSDSGGGAGIQADLKTISLLGSYGMSAVTALTAQNTRGVKAAIPAPTEFVTAQIKAILSDLGADVVKTGMLHSVGIVRAVAEAVRRYSLMVVVDPVMVAKGGAPLLKQDAVEVLRRELLPRTYLLTPNLPEAEALTGITVTTESDMKEAARRLRQMGARNVLIKGGHLDDEPLDLLFEGGRFYRFSAPRIDTQNTHGTGCTYSAAIATFLAQGQPLVRAVANAKRFMNEAISTAVSMGGGHGPVNHFQAAAVFVHRQVAAGRKD